MLIKYPLSTEKAVRLTEENNTVTFIVDGKAKKESVKEEVEKTFNVKVSKVRIVNTKQGKKAYVKLRKDYNALDIATELGLI